METAFESVIEYLPEEAPTFFREGMEQMDALDYPPQVRDLMQRFYQRCCGRRVLHLAGFDGHAPLCPSYALRPLSPGPTPGRGNRRMGKASAHQDGPRIGPSRGGS